MDEREALAYMPLIARIMKNEPVMHDEQVLENIQNNTPYFILSDGTRLEDGQELSREAAAGRKFVMPIVGPITKYGYYGYPGSKQRREWLSEAAQDPTIEEIVFVIDSGGGSGRGTMDFAIDIAKCEKNTTAVFEDVGASAAYWIGSACKQAYITNAYGEVGSIGAYLTLCDGSNFWSDLGISFKDVYATQSKDKNLASRQFAESIQSGADKPDTTAAQAAIDRFCQHFIDTVKSNRPGVDSSCFTGKMYTANEAVSLGLVDGIMSLDQVLSTHSTTRKAA